MSGKFLQPVPERKSRFQPVPEESPPSWVSDLDKEARQFAECVLRNFTETARTVTKDDIQTADARRVSECPISKQGSYVYAAYDANECLLYVGQTGESIKKRFRSHGSGAHFEEDWYKLETAKVRFQRLGPASADGYYRKLLERALILAGGPKYQRD